MSFREKSAWACTVTTLVVFVPYFAKVFSKFLRGELYSGSVLAAFIGIVVFSALLNIVAQIAISIRSRREQKDERDLAIESKALRNAYTVLACSSMSIVCVLVALAPARPFWHHLLALTFVSQMLLLCFVVAETARYVTQAISYRLGS